MTEFEWAVCLQSVTIVVAIVGFVIRDARLNLRYRNLKRQLTEEIQELRASIASAE